MSKKLINEVSKDIISIQFSPNKTLRQLVTEFYSICKKHKIKIHKKVKNGKQGHLFEYTICKTLFTHCLCRSFDFMEWEVNLKNSPSAKIPKEVDC